MANSGNGIWTWHDILFARHVIRVSVRGRPTKYCLWQEAHSSEALHLEITKCPVKSKSQSTASSLLWPIRHLLKGREVLWNLTLRVTTFTIQMFFPRFPKWHCMPDYLCLFLTQNRKYINPLKIKVHFKLYCKQINIYLPVLAQLYIYILVFGYMF
jgi:hypothetical protein